MQSAPDPAREILSSATRHRDERLKRDVYERASVEEYWLIDLDRKEVSVYRRKGAAFEPPLRLVPPAALTTPLIPGLEISLEAVLC